MMLAAKVATNRGVPSLGVIVRRGVREYRSISSLAATRSTHSSIAASPQSYVPKIGFSSAHSAWRQSLTSQPMSTLSRPISTETEVTNLVDNNKVVIYSKSYCPFCAATKRLFERLGEDAAVVVELDTLAEGNQIQQHLKALTGQSTVPSVWVKGKFVGGNSDVQAAAQSGRLQEILKA